MEQPARRRLSITVLLAASPALPALAAPQLQDPVALAAIEQIDITGKRGTERDLPTLRGPVIDMPQLVSTISADTLQARQVTSLEEALRNVAGITTQIGEGGTVNGDQFFIRGQSAKSDIFTDGLRDFGAFTRDSFNFEQVSVLKGPSSTALGRGVSGGAINSGSKLPMMETFQTAGGSVGSAGYHRLQYDGNVEVSRYSALRINLMGHENDAVDRDVVSSRRFGAAAALGFGIGTDTTTNVLYFHQNENRVPDYGVPVITTASANDMELPVTEYGVPRGNFYGYGADKDNATVDTLTLLFKHDFSSEMSFSSNTKVGRYDRYFQQTRADCTAAVCTSPLLDNDPATMPLATISGPGPYRQSTAGVQNVSSLLYLHPVAGFRNELVVGADFSHQRNERLQYNYAAARSQKSLFEPAHDPSPALAAGLNNQRHNTATDYSLFIDDRLWLNPQLSLDVGLRLQRFRNVQDQLNYSSSPGTPLTSCDGVPGRFSSCFFSRAAASTLINPRFAAVWEPSDEMSIYLAYSRSAVPPGNSVGNGDALTARSVGNSISAANLDPEKSRTVDLGLKMAFFRQRLLLQAGIYQTDRSNAQETDPQSGVLVVSSEPKQRLRGFELGLSGAISDTLLLTANYAFIDAGIVEAWSGGSAPVLETSATGNQVRYVPRQAASAWATWHPFMRGWLQPLEFGGGVSYQSKVYLNSENNQSVPAYASYDALIAYAPGRVRLSLNAYNLGNALYYSQVNGGRVVPAAGRSFVANFQYAF